MHDNAYVNRGFSLFRAFHAPEHGWYINADLMAYKDGLRVTAHALHGLVIENGWRGAERVVAEYGTRNAR